jgi:hypothetical protein
MVFTGTVDAVNAALAAGLSYQGNANFFGSDTLTLTVNDQGNTGTLGSAGSNTKTVAITVTPVNDAPTVTDLSLSTSEDTTKTFTLTSSDPDTATSNTTDAAVTGYKIVSVPLASAGVLKTSTGTPISAGTVISVAEATNMTYVPVSNVNGVVTFEYQAVDAAGALSDIATGKITITVAAVNDAPIISGGGDSVAYTEGNGPATAGTPIRLDANSDLAVSDQEITIEHIDDFNGATLTVQRSSADSTDRFSFDSGLVTLSGSNVQVVAGTTIGTYSLSSGVLTVSFNAAATQTAVETVMKSITYASVDDNLSGNVTISMRFNDALQQHAELHRGRQQYQRRAPPDSRQQHHGGRRQQWRGHDGYQRRLDHQQPRRVAIRGC